MGFIRSFLAAWWLGGAGGAAGGVVVDEPTYRVQLTSKRKSLSIESQRFGGQVNSYRTQLVLTANEVVS